MLSEINKRSATVLSDWVVSAIAMALADYFPCSYQATLKLGVKFVQTFANLHLPPDFVKRGYLRDLANGRSFVSIDEKNSQKTEMHNAGEPWGGAFWEIRAALGCQPTIAQCERADKILLAAWASPWLEGPAKALYQRFAQTVIAAVGSSGSPEEVKKVRSIFQRRGLRLPS